MNLIIDPIVGVALSAPFYALLSLITWYVFINKKKTHQDNSLNKAIVFIVNSIMLFVISGFIAYLPYHFGFDFYYYGKNCVPHGSINDCSYGYIFKIDIIIGLMGGIFIFFPIYMFICFFIDALLLFLTGAFCTFFSLFKRSSNAIGSGIKYKKYKGNEYNKFKDSFERKGK